MTNIEQELNIKKIFETYKKLSKPVGKPFIWFDEKITKKLKTESLFREEE